MTMDEYGDLELDPCRTYWGSHGCCLPRGHEDHCICDCAITDAGMYDLETHEYHDERGVYCVGLYPYYKLCHGEPQTSFYGEDAP